MASISSCLLKSMYFLPSSQSISSAHFAHKIRYLFLIFHPVSCGLLIVLATQSILTVVIFRYFAFITGCLMASFFFFYFISIMVFMLASLPLGVIYINKPMSHRLKCKEETQTNSFFIRNEKLKEISSIVYVKAWWFSMNLSDAASKPTQDIWIHLFAFLWNEKKNSYLFWFYFSHLFYYYVRCGNIVWLSWKYAKKMPWPR